MSTGTPVVVSRIQNRRGTQTQFDNLYPGEYTSGPGATSNLREITVNSTDGLVVGSRPQVLDGTGVFAPNTIVTEIISITKFVVSIDPLTPLMGTDNVIHAPKYNGRGGAIGPNILQPGEIALCVDTRRVFIGNINGEYTELSTYIVDNSTFVAAPIVITLAPASSWTAIPPLTHSPTPFLVMLYSVVDLDTHNPNAVGLNFSKSGQLQITATGTMASLVDTCTSINTAPLVPDPVQPNPDIPPDINFKVEYVGLHSIKISYIHNFPIPLTFSTSSIVWAAI